VTHQESHQFWKRVVREEKLGLYKSIVKARDVMMESVLSEEDPDAPRGYPPESKLSLKKKTERMRNSMPVNTL
jgi:hypothetical protein